MSTKFILGGAAIAGATYYAYTHNEPQRHHHETPIPVYGRTREGEMLGQRTGRKVDEAALSAKDKLDELQNQASRTYDKNAARLEKEKKEWKNWMDAKSEEAKDVVDDAKNAVDEKAQSAKESVRQLGEEVRDTNVGAYNTLKDTVNSNYNAVKHSVGDATVKVGDELSRAGDKLRVSADDGHATVKNPSSSKPWLGINTGNKEMDLATEAKVNLEGWGETASQNARDYYESLNEDSSATAKSWLSWGSGKKKETQASIEQAYDNSKKSLEEATKKFNETKDSWFSFGKDKDAEYRKKLHDEAEQQMKEAQKAFDAAGQKLNQWKERAKTGLNDITKDTNTGFYDWLRDGKYEPVPEHKRISEEEIARNAGRALRGWGDSAELFAKEEIEEAKLQSSKAQTSLNNELDSWSKWFNKKYANTAEGAQDFFNDAQTSLKDAKKQLDDNTNHWYTWYNRRSKEVEDEARRQYEEAEVRFKKAEDNLNHWGKEQRIKFWSSAEDTVNSAKEGLDHLHKNTQKGLDKARHWANDRNPED